MIVIRLCGYFLSAHLIHSRQSVHETTWRNNSAGVNEYQYFASFAPAAPVAYSVYDNSTILSRHFGRLQSHSAFSSATQAEVSVQKLQFLREFIILLMR